MESDFSGLSIEKSSILPFMTLCTVCCVVCLMRPLDMFSGNRQYLPYVRKFESFMLHRRIVAAAQKVVAAQKDSEDSQKTMEEL